MAKKTDTTEPTLDVREDALDHFINSTGRTVYCNPVAQDYLTALFVAIEKQYRNRGEPLDPPTYEFEAEGGMTMVAPHDETTINDPKTTPEEKAAWDAHVDALVRFVTEREEKGLKALCLKGVKFNPDGREYKEWVEEQAFIGMPLPENDLERRYLFIRSNLIITVSDLLDSDKIKLTETCFMLGFKGATKEQIAQMRELFRRQMEGTGRDGNTPERAGDGGEE